MAMVLASCTSAAFATEPDRGMAGCAAIQNNINRLSCFDDLARARKVDAPEVVSAGENNWSVTTETSKIDDSKNVFLQVESENEFEGKYGSNKKASIMIACRQGKTDLFFSFGDHFMADSGGYGDITVRIDRQKAINVSTIGSTDHGALGLWNGTGIKLIKSLFGKSKLLVVATPFSENSITVEFDVQGIEKAVSPLRKACKW
jgi:type VI secretion system protein VasI